MAWIKQKKTPDGVSLQLKLDENIDTVLNSPKLTTWVRFMMAYNKKNPDGVTLLGTLTKHYETVPLVKMIEISRRSPDTRRLANRLQDDQLTDWAGNGLSTDVVYSILKVGNGSVEKQLANPALNVWFYYFNRMNNYQPDKEVNMSKKLTSSYDDMDLSKAIEVATKDKTTEIIAKRLQTAQFKSWFADDRDPRTVFNMLKLDKKKWLYDSNVGVYRAYNLFYKANKK
ncbi:putative secreted RxLR effector peptide protein [Phytophthora cinnamomi]|uniref:putative secreted RxLR effector peptide protein n=1 Tax=Phytophthora cinnamomi TaxID=4785 RepID=UPI00355A0231|nr:putative secreted RxLR effector peptide protein [Phytophthora cinnamomi]